MQKTLNLTDEQKDEIKTINSDHVEKVRESSRPGMRRGPGQAEENSKKMIALRKAFVQMGMIDHPYMPIPFLLTLSVIPHARITDKGIFDVDGQKFLEPISQVRNKTKA